MMDGFNATIEVLLQQYFVNFSQSHVGSASHQILEPCWLDEFAFQPPMPDAKLHFYGGSCRCHLWSDISRSSTFKEETTLKYSHAYSEQLFLGSQINKLIWLWKQQHVKYIVLCVKLEAAYRSLSLQLGLWQVQLQVLQSQLYKCSIKNMIIIVQNFCRFESMLIFFVAILWEFRTCNGLGETITYSNGRCGQISFNYHNPVAF